jgi:hypothetical protein
VLHCAASRSARAGASRLNRRWLEGLSRGELNGNGMSAALNLNQQADSSFQSLGTPDLSLGSLISAVPTPSKSLRVSSLSSNTTAPSSAPLSTPSPPHAPIRRKGDEATPVALRRHIGREEDDDDLESDVLNASQKENNWEGDLGTPLNTRGKRSKSNATNPKGNNLTLRDQEKVCGPSCLL